VEKRSALRVNDLSTLSANLPCTIRHNAAAGGAHRRDRIGQVDGGGLLRAKGATIVDADEVARAVVEPGQPALAALVERFGPEVLDADGRLDRPALAAIAFADDDGRKALGEITWPAIGEEFERQIRDAPDDAVVICDVPLLVESKAAAARPYVAVVVVEAPLELRLERLEIRGVARDDAQRRMAAQASDDERREVATHVIDNGGDLESLSRQVDEVWADLLTREAPAPATTPE
jgi:dephospho-CoA kinase